MRYLAWISGSALDAMIYEAEKTHPYETGGVLLGWKNGADYVVNNIIGPGPKARHRRYRFRPDGEFRVSEIAKFFEKTRGKETYLGDWHTHPAQEIPRISWLDRRELRRIANFPAAQIDEPLMAIMGAPANRSLVIWKGKLDRILFYPFVNTTQLPIRPYHKARI